MSSDNAVRKVLAGPAGGTSHGAAVPTGTRSVADCTVYVAALGTLGSTRDTYLGSRL